MITLAVKTCFLSYETIKNGYLHVIKSVDVDLQSISYLSTSC